MRSTQHAPLPAQCPACAAELVVTRLQCPACGTEVGGAFRPGRLINLPEPHASLLELFLRVRGNAKELERALGVSYPTVRARLERAIAAAGLDQHGPVEEPDDGKARRAAILEELARGDIDAAEAAARLRDVRQGRAI